MVNNRLYRAELFGELRFPTGRIHEDEFIAHELFLKCKKVVYLKEPWYCYVQRPGSIMKETFSLRRLDGAEACLERVRFALDRDLKELAPYACRQALDLVSEGYRHLDRKDPEVRERLACLRRRVLEFYPEVRPLERTGKGRLIFLLFALHAGCYLLAKDLWVRWGTKEQGAAFARNHDGKRGSGEDGEN